MRNLKLVPSIVTILVCAAIGLISQADEPLEVAEDEQEIVEDRDDQGERHFGRRRPNPQRMNPDFRRRFEDEEEGEGGFGIGELLEMIHDSSDGLEIEIHVSSRRREREHDRPDRPVAERLEHLRMAVEHLHQAGMHEVAEEVARHVRSRKQDDDERRPHRGEGPHEEVMKQLNELRHEVERLRDEVSELRKNSLQE